MTRSVAIDDVARHNQRMWDRLAAAGIPYTRPQGTPPKTRAAKRRFLDPNDRLAGMPLDGQRVLALAGGGGWHPVLFAELGAETTVLDISARQLKTVRELARSRDAKVRVVQGDMRDLSGFADGSFDIVWHSHSIVFVPDAHRVIAEVGRVLAPGGVYRASTMHPVTLRMYGTWNGTVYSPTSVNDVATESTTETALVVIPRVGIDLGGDAIRVRLALEADTALVEHATTTTGMTTTTGSQRGVIGVELAAGVAYQW